MVLESTQWTVEEAVAAAREGDRAAFGLLYQRYSNAIHSYASRVLGDTHLADDVTQDTFLKAFRSIGRLRDDTRLEGWLYAIASRRCLDILRRRQLLAWLPFTHERVGVVEDAGAEAAEREQVQQALRRLPPKEAVCLVLRVVEEFSCEEIAEMLGISTNAVWTRLCRARRAFARAYEDLSRLEGDQE